MVLPVKKIAIALFTACFPVLCLAGCDGKQGQQKPVSQPVKIAVCVADMERDGNKIIKKVMEERKKKEQLDITWLDAKNDSTQQASQVEKLAQQKVKAVVLQVVDPAAGSQLLRGLAEKNIKVVALEALPVDAPVDAYVASNHSLAGRLMAEYVINAVRKKNGIPLALGEPGTAGQGQQQQGAAGGGGGGKQQGGGQGGSGQQQGGGGQSGGSQEGGGQEGGQSSGGSGGGQQSGGSQQGGGQAIPPESQLQGKGPANVVLLTGDPSDPASQEIASAARTVLKESQWARLVGEYQNFHGDPAQVPFNMQQALAANNNRIDAVLATDSRLALAAVDVLKAAGLNNMVLTVGVGADQKASQALASGEHDAEVDTRPDLLGQYALDAAVSLARDEHWQYDSQSTSGSYSVPSRITPVRLVQPENMYLLNQRWSGLQGGGSSEGGSSGSSKGGSESGSGKSGGDEQSGSQQGSGQESGKQGGQSQKTKLKVTTMDGKTVEVEINGQVKKIESTDGGQQKDQQSQGGEGQQGGGGGQ